MITLSSGLVVKQPLVERLIPMFESSSGARVEATFAPTTVILQGIGAGERPDLVLGVAESLSGLTEQGVLAPDTLVELAVSAVGFARLPSTPAPVDGEAQTFLDYLLAARAVAYSLSGASGLHFAQVLEQHGLRDRIDEHAVRFPEGLTAEAVVDGRVDVAIQQVSELRSVAGEHVVEPIPHQLQSYARFAIGARPGAPDVARQFIDFLRGSQAAEAFEAVGLSTR